MLSVQAVPDGRILAVLLLAAEAGGFLETSGDPEAAEACVAFGWLIHEGLSGYGITCEGHAALRQAGQLTERKAAEAETKVK